MDISKAARGMWPSTATNRYRLAFSLDAGRLEFGPTHDGDGRGVGERRTEVSDEVDLGCATHDGVGRGVDAGGCCFCCDSCCVCVALWAVVGEVVPFLSCFVCADEFPLQKKCGRLIRNRVILGGNICTSIEESRKTW